MQGIMLFQIPLTALLLLASTATALVNFADALGKRDLVADLLPELSLGASIYTPSSPNWANESSRWSTYCAPSFSSVVVPATEEDIIVTLKYVNSRNISLLAQGGGHGYSATLGMIQNGVMVNLQNFDYAVVNSDLNTVKIGGGTKFSTLINAAYAAGRELTVASSPCPGAVGAILGGGHGRLQGKHGLSIDAVASMDVVLWDGTSLTVSATQNAELFYGMKGAGQNYGIVTSVTLNTYPQTTNGTHYNNDMIFSNATLEDLFQTINDIIPVQPAELALVVIVAVDSETSEPIMILNLVYAGSKSDAQPWIDKFTALSPLSTSESQVTWADLPYKAADGSFETACSRGVKQDSYTVNLKSFDVSTVRRYFDAFGDFVTTNPAAADSIFLYEIFAQQAVIAAPANSSAYPNRGYGNILVLFEMVWTDDSVASAADSFGQDVRAAYEAVSGYDKQYVYQNYAHGDEPLEALYGYESWRLAKLRNLKREYDPKDVFKAYHDVYSTPFYGNYTCS